jgi:hypothetical protein
MSLKAKLFSAIAGAGLAALAVTAPAQALTMSECSAKYKAAKGAGTLNGMKWNDFRNAECGTDATPAAAPAPAVPKEAKTQAAPTAAPALPSGSAIFPTAIDPKYSKQSAG